MAEATVLRFIWPQSCRQRRGSSSLAPGSLPHDFGRMWNQPYLETCCRSALHRLMLAGDAGRPPALKDGPCLVRLQEDGFAVQRPDGRYEATATGAARHDSEILRRVAAVRV